MSRAPCDMMARNDGLVGFVCQPALRSLRHTFLRLDLDEWMAGQDLPLRVDDALVSRNLLRAGRANEEPGHNEWQRQAFCIRYLS
jgi:hypothetical protein